jgi:RNA polymerase sigma factor (sigma-70 family)
MGDMATSRDGELVRHLGQLFGRGTVAGLADVQILERYIVHRDEPAFEALVARHGPMVLGVCRRLLRDPNDIDDAFQATFLILARKADKLRDRDALGPWLHGVAFRVASRARAATIRRRRREPLDARAIELAPAPGSARPDLRWLLDEEILRLPARLRLPVVLCLIEGRTYDEAAEQLRWTSGMVRGRLAEARARLRERLIRRGEAPAIAGVLSGLETSSLPPSLVVLASRTSARVVSGKVVASSAVSLANRVMGGWLMGRVVAAALVVIAASMAVGIGWARTRPASMEPRPAVPVVGPIAEQAVARQAPASQRRRGALDAEIHLVTIEGRAVDGEGRPVAGASIVVTNANRARTGDVVLGRAVSGPDGRYILRETPLPVLPPEPGPIPRSAEAKFEVAGSAPGLAFAWHRTQSFRPVPRPADFIEDQAGQVVFMNQAIVADLVFGPPARVRGRIIDDQGKPVAGARIQFGAIDNTRNTNAYAQHYCAGIDPKGGEDVPFNGIGSLPEEVRSARSDAEGRYEINSLPREAKLIVLIDQDPTFESYSFSVATSASGFDGVNSLGHDGVVNHTFIRPRTVRARVIFADSGRPATGVTVLAQGEKIQRAGAIATTDPEGFAALELPPGSFKLRVEPTIGMAYRVAEGFLDVGGQATGPTIDLKIEPGAPVLLEAVDVDNGRPIAGIGFDFVAETSADRREVQSRPAYVDHPVTDDSGQLRAVMDPGRGQFLPGRTPRDYEATTKASPILSLKPGEPTTARFTFRKRPEDPAQAARPEEDEVGRRLRLIWERQAGLLQRGRLRAIESTQTGGDLPAEGLRRLLESLDPDQIPGFLDRLETTFPEAQAPSTGRLKVVVDGRGRRQEMSWGASGPDHSTDVTVENGRENINYQASNAQVNIGDDGPKSGTRLGVACLEDFCRWPTWGGRVVGRAKGRVTLESRSGNDLTTIVADESTGFVYHETEGSGNGSQTRDFWQFAPRKTAKGAMIPGLSVEFLSARDRILFLHVRTIESIDLETPIPPETFLVSIPPGTQVLDYREGREDTYRGVVRRPVTDVVAYADADPRRFKPFVRPVKEGQAAPPIEPLVWLDAAGKVEALNLAGKVVLVDFWGIECGPCLAQLPEVREAVEHFSAKGLVIVGLHDSSGEPERVAEFASKRGLTWLLAIDRPGEGFGTTFTAYGVRAIPSAVVIDRQGQIAFLGDFKGALAKAATLLEER